jgi:anti-sigma regulatory factor (Ser/Thr protein kinase)
LRVGPESIEAVVSNTGPAVDPQRVAARPVADAPSDRESLSEHGRGLAIIRGIFEDVSFERVGNSNRLRMSKRRGGAGS